MSGRFEDITLAYKVKGTGKWMFVHIPEGHIDIDRRVQIERSSGHVDPRATITITTDRQWVVDSRYEEEAVEDGSIITGQIIQEEP